MLRYEFSEGNSNKFWEIALNDTSFTVCYGKIGTAGQSQTKSFNSAELAHKEHDKLIAEKTKKGYQLAKGNTPAGKTSAPPPSSPKPAPAAAASLRKDLYVYNEATGMIITSQKLQGKGWDSSGKEWEKAVKNGDLIPMELFQDDPFVIRVVVGGALEVQEAEEWTGVLDWKLRVPDGKLVIGGGSMYVMEEFEEIDDYMSDYIRFVDIPKGEYRATLYMYLSGVNGRPCLITAKGGDEPDPLGEWFRATRPGEKFPVWLHNDCVCDPAEDPGHEKEWKKAKPVEDPNKYYVEFLLHLTPLADQKVSMPALEDGWFSDPTECRVPKRIPLGIPAIDVEGLPKKEVHTPQAVEVFKFTQPFKRVNIEGGPVEVPLAHLERLYRIPWSCHVWSFPQLKVTLPASATFPDTRKPIECVFFTPKGNELLVGFESVGSQSLGLKKLAQVSEVLKGLPDGTEIELDALYNNPDELKKPIPMGTHRYFGKVKFGKWLVSEAFPTVKAEILNEALKLSATVESEKSVETGDAATQARVLEILGDHAFFSDNPAVKVGATGIGMKKPEPLMLNFIAAEVLKTKFSSTWPMDVRDDDDEEEEAEPVNPTHPPKKDEIFKGAEKRVYYFSSPEKLDKDGAKKAAEVEQQVTALGYKHVVDLVCKPLDQFLLRAYSHPASEHWVFLMVGQFGRGVFEFVTYLERGGSLTTTQIGNANDEIYRDNFKTSKPGAPAAELLKLHQARLAHLSEFHGPARKLDATPLGLAKDLEYSFISKAQPKPGKGRKLLVDFGDGKGEPEMGMLDYRRYYTADARELNPHTPKLLAAMDADMKKLGFEHLGDAAGTFMGSLVFRGYAKSGGDVFAYWHVLAALTDTALGNLEFVTHYEKGAVLTSSRTAMSKDEPKRKIFRNLDPKGTPEKLLALHEKRKGDLTAKFGKTIPIKLEPREVAVQAEGFIERTIG